MDAVKLAGLEPASVFGYFEKICSIPHGSRNTKLISDYLVSFAKEHDLETSIQRAKDYISGALADMLDLGRGSGPMNHAFELNGRTEIK